MLLIALSACCFGAIPILTTLATGAGAPLTTVLAWRYLLAAAVLVPVAGLAALLRAGRRALPLLLIAGGGQAVIAFVSLSALRYIPAASLTFLFYTYPAWVAIIAALRGAERVTPLRALALGLSLSGIFIMVGSPWAKPLHATGVLLALASALIYAAYIPTINHLRGDLSASVATIYVALGAGTILAISAAASGGFGVPLHRTAWIATGLLALLSTAAAFLAFLRGLRVLGPVRTAIVSTVEPFCTAVLGAVVLSQDLNGATLVGGALIALAVVLLQRGQG
jgi:drug/metabolite transporter (DMT)-like permease